MGRAMARGLARAGADVVIAGRHEDELKAAAGSIGGTARVAWVAADLSRRGEAGRLAREAQAAIGRIDALVNNAGSNTPSRSSRSVTRTGTAWSSGTSLPGWPRPARPWSSTAGPSPGRSSGVRDRPGVEMIDPGGSAVPAARTALRRVRVSGRRPTPSAHPRP
ncbi:MAG: SDR family NAD(P)-dependent oxidoreductase, partial [Planctomycetia bacterium]|nr:SDR family NAD(P)-dependent oxidoreductase [Planctomycetia bacterium]